MIINLQVAGSDIELSDQLKAALIQILGHHESFSKVRDVEKASVKLRFRIMTEAKAEGNILNSKRYPEIAHNTLNFVLPAETDEQSFQHSLRLRIALSSLEFLTLKYLKIKHPLNGYFDCFQLSMI